MKCGVRQIITIICVTYVQKDFHIQTLINWTSVTSSPIFFFSKKFRFFFTKRSVGIGNDCMLIFTGSSAHLLRNIDICSNFYFFKSTSINTQHSGLWDTLGIMLTHWPNRLKIFVFAYFKVLLRTRYKEIDVIFVQCLFKQLLTKYQIFTKLPQISHIHKNRNF